MWRRNREKIDRCAMYMAQIQHGIFDWEAWGYTRIPRHKDGTVRVPGDLIRRFLGITGNDYARYLKSKYYKERYRYHMMRMDEGFRNALAELTKDDSALSLMRAKLWESIWESINDPETLKRIPLEKRAQLFLRLTELEAKMKGDIDTRKAVGPSTTNILAIMGQSVSTEELKQIAASLERTKEEVADIIEGVVEDGEE